MNIELKAKDIIIGVGVLGSLVFLFARLPNFNEQHATERKEILEDKQEERKQKTEAFTHMKDCETGVNLFYNQQWKKACKQQQGKDNYECFHILCPSLQCSKESREIKYCDSIYPQDQFDPDCTLKSGAEGLNKILSDNKAECRLTYQYEIGAK
jgi:hypothetical protein